MGITRSANGPTHGEVIFPFACFPCFMVTVPFILSHYSSKYWYKNSLLLINPWLRKLKPVTIRILLSVQLSGLTAVCCSITVDRKRLYMYKKRHFLLGGGGGACPLKIDTSVDKNVECQSWYQIRKGSFKGLKNEKAK